MTATRISATPTALEWQRAYATVPKYVGSKLIYRGAKLEVTLQLQVQQRVIDNAEGFRESFGRLTERRVRALIATIPEQVTLERTGHDWKISQTDTQNWVDAAREIIESKQLRYNWAQPEVREVPTYTRGPYQAPAHNPVLSPELAAQLLKVTAS
jgi:hypothetical protein